MAEALRSSQVGADALTFVPLHPRRQRERGFNQAELLARAVGEGLGLPVPDCLRRIQATPSQVGLSGRERRINLESAFVALNAQDRLPPGLSKLALVDDVCTTGTTLAAARAALEAAGIQVACYTVLASPQTLAGVPVTFAGSPGVPNLVRGELK
jgi:predicted amidophosphoribosyltransferase